MPRPAPEPSVSKLTPVVPFEDTAPAIVIMSDGPSPVSMPKLWFDAPLVTAARFTPPEPTVTASVPDPPTTVIPAKPVIFDRLTASVSFAASIVIPEIGVGAMIVPAVSAVIVSTFEAELYDVERSLIVVPSGSSASTTWLSARVTNTSFAASIARHSRPSNPRSAANAGAARPLSSRAANTS